MPMPKTVPTSVDFFMIFSLSSNPARQEQDNKYDQDQPDYTTGSVSPASAVRPSRYDPKQGQDQDNQQYCSDTHGSTLVIACDS
jgi:hypothetical protein